MICKHIFFPFSITFVPTIVLKVDKNGEKDTLFDPETSFITMHMVEALKKVCTIIMSVGKSNGFNCLRNQFSDALGPGCFCQEA
jgi:hypothetical protein